ncbi:MAG: helix-turn-helix domain-containing protein [Candidatus Gracilibacteria bacterium]
MIVKEELLGKLRDIGFSEKEAKIYLTVLELKEALPGSIARRSGVKRSTAYLLLDQLAKRGLLTSIKKNGHLFYQAKNPQVFIKEELEKSENLHASLEDLNMGLPELLLLHKMTEERVEVSVFKGAAALEQMRKNIRAFKGKIHHYDHLGSEVTIYGEKVAIISWEDETGVVIQSKNIAKAQKVLLDEGFKGKKK